MRKVLLYSGGLDSAALFFHLNKPHCLYMGGPHGPARWANAGEIAAIANQRALCADFHVKIRMKELDFRPFMRPLNVDYMFPRLEIMCLAAWAEQCDGVIVAYTREDMPSWHGEYVAQRLRDCLPFKFSVDFPAVEMSRAELVASALDHGAPPDFLLASHSCVRRSQDHCGECDNCRQRLAALEACNLVNLNHNAQ